jgi:hypothetical protein
MPESVWTRERRDNYCTLKLNLTYCVALVREIIQTENGRLSAKLATTFADRGVPRGHRNGSLRPYSRLSRPESLLLLSSSSSIVLARLSGPRSRPTASQ